MPEISVIVPVYNVEKYIEKCVCSILEQTFTDFELILIDDGSTDSSGQYCDKIQEQDERIKVIHKKNGGLSSARNAGIDVATGKYLTFIDSDDYIAENMLNELYQDINRENAELAMVGLYHVYADSAPSTISEEYHVLSQEETTRLILIGKLISVNAVAKLYKKELFNEVRYPVGKAYEDAFTIMKVITQCSKIVVNTKQYYYYFHRQGSITTNTFSVKDLECIEAWEENYEIISKQMPLLKDLAFRRVCWANFYVLDKIVVADKEKETPEMIGIVKFLKRNRSFIFKNDYFAKSRKLALFFLCIHLSFYKVFPKLQQKHLRKMNV